MENKEGICKMCNRPLLVVGPTGKTPIFCEKCLDKIQAKTKMAMEKRGQVIGNKSVKFRY